MSEIIRDCGSQQPCDYCKNWFVDFLPRLKRRLSDHEGSVRTGRNLYIPPPPIPENPCSEVEAALKLSRERGIIP